MWDNIVARHTLAQINSGRLQEANQSQSVFSNEELSKHFKGIDQTRLKGIFNNIEKTKAGRDILMTLKALLREDPNKRKIEFKIETQRSLVEKTKDLLGNQSINNEGDAKVAIGTMDLNTKAVFIGTVNKYAMDATTNPITVSINEEFLYHERFVFDGEKIVAINLEEMLGSKEAAEAYLVAHELVHCIQFLSNENNVMYKATNEDWNAFFQTDKMKPIYDKIFEFIKKEGLNKEDLDKKIYDTFKALFENVEEARNLLGFVPENRQDLPEVGEFFLFNEKEKFLLPTYLTKVKELTEIEKTVLNTIAEELNVHLQNVSTTRYLFPRF